jgi:ELWxxDGT repeat protein
MNAKTATFLALLPICLGLLPAAAAAQGSVGSMLEFSTISPVAGTARAGSLAFFNTVAPGSYPPYLPGFIRSDGTSRGTFSIDPRGTPLVDYQSIQVADNLGGLLFFVTAKHQTFNDRGLWRSDGTAAGTVPVTQGLEIAVPQIRSVPERSLLFFSAASRPEITDFDFELWATDGTLGGTRLVKDLNPERSSNPRQMIAFGGRLFFFADTPQSRQLWRSDGTPAGTVRVHDFLVNAPETLDLVQADGALFVLQGTESGVEVWRSDGTEAGTERVLDLPQQLHNYQTAGRHLFLVTRNTAHTEMWAVGGTGEAVRVLQVGTAQEIEIHATADHLVFSLEDDHGREPWWSDGTPGGTHLIADICPGPCSSVIPSSLFAGTYGERAVLRLDDGVSGTEPWLTDGTAAGTWRLADLCAGECSASLAFAQEVNRWLVLRFERDVWVTDGTPDGAWRVANISPSLHSIALPDRLLFFTPFQGQQGSTQGYGVSLSLTAPPPPPGDWLETAGLPGFRFKVQIDGGITGRQESACLTRTLCVSGALPGRSELFLRISGRRPNGRLWPAVIKLTASAADVWVLQTATGHLRHYRLEGSESGATLPGILDRDGFGPPPSSADAGPELAAEEAGADKADPPPPSPWIDSQEVPGFRIQARVTSGGTSRIMSQEACIPETFCLSGALPGVTELLVRVTGPRPNGYYWPHLARFTPSPLEVWIQQKTTGTIRYYPLNAQPAGSSQLDGLFDRLGFRR